MDNNSPPPATKLEEVAASVGASLMELRTLTGSLDGEARAEAERLTERLESAATSVQGVLNGIEDGDTEDSDALADEHVAQDDSRRRRSKRKHKRSKGDAEDGSDESAWTTVQLGAQKVKTDGIALSGHTASIAVPEVLGFLASLRKSGTLRVENPQEVFQIELRQGSVVYAHGANPPKGLRLGQILVQQGAVSQEQLDDFLAASGSGMVGNGLLQGGIVTEEALRIALAYQAQHVFHRLYASTDATFEFREDVHVDKPEDIQLNVTRLLLESARSIDERAAEVDQALSWLDS